MAGIVHCLIHAEYMALDPDPAAMAGGGGGGEGRPIYRPRMQIKRYWQVRCVCECARAFLCVPARSCARMRA